MKRAVGGGRWAVGKPGFASGVLLLVSTLILSGCGYFGEPLYPLLNIPNRVGDLTAVQRGGVIVYQFTLPLLTTEGKQARIGRVELRAGEAGPGTFHVDDWAARAKPMDVVYDQGKPHVMSEMPASPWVGKDLVLAVKVYGVNKREAGWSNTALLAVIAPLEPPMSVEATAVAEGVRVTWKGSAERYKIFRRVEDNPNFALMATVEKNEWIDAATEYRKRYEYKIQALRKLATGDVESELSEAASVTPEDKFPPAVPKGLNAIVATQGFELVWERNTEPDLAGYRLYRSVGGGAFEKLADVADTPSYSDRSVESGKVYRYKVSSVDRSQNESAQSEPVEILAP